MTRSHRADLRTGRAARVLFLFGCPGCHSRRALWASFLHEKTASLPHSSKRSIVEKFSYKVISSGSDLFLALCHCSFVPLSWNRISRFVVLCNFSIICQLALATSLCESNFLRSKLDESGNSSWSFALDIGIGDFEDRKGVEFPAVPCSVPQNG